MTKQVPCPIKNHKHQLELVEHPEKQNLLVAYCGGTMVIQKPKPQRRSYRKRTSKAK